MKYSIIFAGLLLFFGLQAQSQTIINGVVTDSLDKPIPSATVYLSRTTFGVFTDVNGAYSLTISQDGVYELITSCLGYKPYSQFISAEGKKLKIDIKLSVNLIQLNEVTVKSKDKNRLAKYTQFAKLFLGETINSQSCKILNQDDLRLYRNSVDGTLTGFSLNPLRIENKALGYIIIYDLADFSYNPVTRSLRFKGNNYFQQLNGEPRDIKRWTHNRLSAYYGSRMNLFRSIFSDSLYTENFKLFECRIDSVTEETTIIKPILPTDLSLERNINYMTMYYNNPVLINYTDNHPELSTGLTGFQPQNVISTLVFSDFINVYRNGNFDNPYSITWGGEMANERIADMVPFDFQPRTKEQTGPDLAANTSAIDKYMLIQQSKTSRDQVFVHTDRNMYNPGDTIYFQAYIRDRFTNQFESGSVSLYSLLYNDKQVLVDSSRFRIEKSTSPGWMAIPYKAEPGRYHFVSFTGMMQNYDPVDAFQLDIDIKARAIRHESTSGMSDLKMIKKKREDNNSMATDSITLPDKQYLELRFLPEGGTSVEGLKQRIGFNATDYRGEPVFVEGLLKNSEGLILDTIRSGRYGPGIFICTPEPGMYVDLIKGAGNDKSWPLPVPATKGICLKAEPVNNRSFAVEIQASNYTGDPVTVSGTMNYTQIFSKDLKLDKKQHITIETDQLLSGVVRITLFNKELKPVAERLMYVNPDKNLRFNVRTEDIVCSPGQETQLSITVSDGTGKPVEGIFSVSVCDSLSGHNAELFTPGIEYAFNYHPDFLANLPSKVLVEGLENLTTEDRDLILMVYGWSKYSWDFSGQAKSINEEVDYELLKMKILYALKKNRSDRRLDLISLEGPSVKHLLTDRTGEISLPLDSLSDVTRSVTLMPDPKNKKRVMGAMLTIPYNEQYFKSDKLLTPQMVIPLDSYSQAVSSYNFPLNDSTVNIEEVTITGHLQPARVYHDKYEEMYQSSNIKSLDYELLWTSTSVEDAVRRLISPFAMTNEYVVIIPPRSFLGGAIPALIVVDGTPIYSDGWMYAKTIQPGEITSLTILKGTQGTTLYGMEAAGGVIFINTRSRDPNLMKIRTNWRLQHTKDKMLLPIRIYRSGIEFYSPTKLEIQNDPVIHNRSLIFWDPEVYFNGKEPVKIKYNNLLRQGPVVITLNGASFNNLVGTGKAGYMVYE
jgi:hypothetical protein